MKAIFAAGCFWGVESTFAQLTGVTETAVGYTGGHTEDPNYDEVCSGSTGHAEAVEVGFDPELISYEQLAEVFFRAHDPTTLNRQGPDIGTQYRSAIFYFDEDQKAVAELVKDRLSRELEASIVTEIKAASQFYPAELYHQGYELDSKNRFCKLR